MSEQQRQQGCPDELMKPELLDDVHLCFTEMRARTHGVWGSEPEDLALTYLCLIGSHSVAHGWSEEKYQRLARWWWPMTYFQIYGVQMGRQWGTLGWLAARYARECTAEALAAHLWKVVQASPQNMRHPWRRRQIESIAQRAKRFIDRQDAREAALLEQARRWLGVA